MKMARSKDGDGIKSELIIAEVEKRPILFDTNHQGFGERSTKSHCWEEVCAAVVPNWDKMGADDKLATGKEVLKRWRSIRDSYTKQYRAGKCSPPSSLPSGGRRRHKHQRLMGFLYDTLQRKALQPSTDKRQPESNLTTPLSDTTISISPDKEEPKTITNDIRVPSIDNLAPQELSNRNVENKSDKIDVQIITEAVSENCMVLPNTSLPNKTQPTDQLDKSNKVANKKSTTEPGQKITTKLNQKNTTKSNQKTATIPNKRSAVVPNPLPNKIDTEEILPIDHLEKTSTPIYKDTKATHEKSTIIPNHKSTIIPNSLFAINIDAHTILADDHLDRSTTVTTPPLAVEIAKGNSAPDPSLAIKIDAKTILPDDYFDDDKLFMNSLLPFFKKMDDNTRLTCRIEVVKIIRDALQAQKGMPEEVTIKEEPRDSSEKEFVNTPSSQCSALRRCRKRKDEQDTLDHTEQPAPKRRGPGRPRNQKRQGGWPEPAYSWSDYAADVEQYHQQARLDRTERARRRHLLTDDQRLKDDVDSKPQTSQLRREERARRKAEARAREEDEEEMSRATSVTQLRPEKFFKMYDLTPAKKPPTASEADRSTD